MNLVRFNKSKCKVLHLGQGNARHEDRLGEALFESRAAEEDLGVLVDKRLDMNQQRALAGQKANCILGCINRGVASQLREGLVPPLLHPSEASLGVLHPGLDPQRKKDLNLLVRVQRRGYKDDQRTGAPLL